MQLLRFISSLLFLYILSASPAVAAGFDCSKASTNIELMICSDEELSLLDTNLSVLYKKNRDVNHSLIEEQKIWIRQVRNKCADIICLKRLYKKRILEINSAKASEEKCKVSDIKGMWQKKSGQAFEEIYFNTDDNQKKFTTWLHHKAEFTGIWALDNCILRLEKIGEPKIEFVWKIKKITQSDLDIIDLDENLNSLFVKKNN